MGILALLLIASCLYPSFSNADQPENGFCFEKAGEFNGINPGLLRSLAKIESGLNSGAVNNNPNGSIDMGLMQINSEWVKKLGLNASDLLSDPCYNTIVGARILKYCIASYGYTWKAVGCYNASSPAKRVEYSWKVFNELKNNKDSASPLEPVNSRIPEPSPSSLFFSVRDK